MSIAPHILIVHFKQLKFNLISKWLTKDLAYSRATINQNTSQGIYGNNGIVSKQWVQLERRETAKYTWNQNVFFSVEASFSKKVWKQEYV